MYIPLGRLLMFTYLLYSLVDIIAPCNVVKTTISLSHPWSSSGSTTMLPLHVSKPPMLSLAFSSDGCCRGKLSLPYLFMAVTA